MDIKLHPLKGEQASIRRERIKFLVEKAREMWELKIKNIHLRHGDGMLGWKRHSPFDAILVAAAPIAFQKSY